MRLLLNLFQQFLVKKWNRGLVCRNVRSVLCPQEKRQWRRVVLTYYVKKLCTGGRPVQEFAFLEKMFWGLVLRELVAQVQFPAPPQLTELNEQSPPAMKWDFDETELGVNGQDCDVGEDGENLWSLSLFDLEA